ncbi:hypothetical protein ACLMJK_001802 [Lecanora helva]
MVLVGTLFLRVVPNSLSYTPLSDHDDRSGSDSSTLLKRTKSEEVRYSAERSSNEPGTQPENISYHRGGQREPTGLDQPVNPSTDTEETSSLLSKSTGSGPGDMPYQNGNSKSGLDQDSQNLDVRGLALLSKMKFYQLWLMLGLLTGIGLMTINNIGSDVSSIVGFINLLTRLTQIAGSSDLASLRRQCIF